jgi:hypothetical protein
MKLFLFFLTVFSVCFATLHADPNPERSWIPCSDGISVSLVLHGNTIEVRIKNTSKNPKELLHPWGNIHVSCIDEKGRRIPLGEHFYGDERDEIDVGGGPSGWNLPPEAESGEQISVLLSHNDPELVKKYPVVFSTVIADPSLGKTVDVESPPKMLVPKE